MKQTSIAYPPPKSDYSFWERSLDPWHPDAFADVEAPSVRRLFKVAKKTPRAEGWMGMDHCGNCLLFIPDGSEFESHDDDYILKESYPGVLCAVPNIPHYLQMFNDMHRKLHDHSQCNNS